MAFLIPAAVGIGSALIGANAANSAASQQSESARKALELQRQMYDESRALQQPYIKGGELAQNRLLELLGLGSPGASGSNYGKYAKDFSMSDFEEDPGYSFRLKEGMKALDRTNSARGNLFSGSALKGAQRFGQELASQEYTNAFNRYQTNRLNQLNPLGSLVTAGQNSATGAGANAMNFGVYGGDLYTQQGNAQAAGTVGQSNAFTSGLEGLGNYYNSTQLLEALKKSPSSSESWV